MVTPPTRTIRRGSALIVDVVNFRSLEPHSLEDVAAILDDLYTGIASAVTGHNGEVVKWLGDGALACFWGEGHELNAVRAGPAVTTELCRVCPAAQV